MKDHFEENLPKKKKSYLSKVNQLLVEVIHNYQCIVVQDVV